MSDAKRPLFFWIALLICAAYVAALSFNIYVDIRYYGLVKDPGWALRVTNAGWIVSRVDPAGPVAGHLEVGDRLLSFNGDARAAVLGTARFINVADGETYHAEFDRQGRRISIALPLVVTYGGMANQVFMLIGLSYFVCGALFALLRPGDPQVRFIGITMVLLAIGFIEATLGGMRAFLTGWERVALVLAATPYIWGFPMVTYAFSRFPDWRPLGRGQRAWHAALFVMCGVVVWPSDPISYLGLDVAEGVNAWLASHPRLFLAEMQVREGFRYLYMIACLLLALASLAITYRRLESADGRRRIRWIVAGLAVAVVPFGIITFAARVTGWLSDPTYRAIIPFVSLLQVAVPAAFVVAVWKNQLFDIGVLVRRGLQYLFARTALQFLLALPVALLVISIVSNPNRTIAEILTQGSGWVNVLLIAIGTLALRSRQRLQAALDRRFFREAYEQEQVLTQLIDEVRQRDSLGEIAKLVSGRIDSVLHPSSLHIFYRAQDRSETFDGHSSSGAITGRELATQRELVELLDRDKAIRDVPSGVAGLAESERHWLDQLGIRLMVPIAGARERLAGVLLLGARKSEEPYSSTDRRLLEAIAGQIGLVYENQHLHERVRREADLRREVLSRVDDRGVRLLKECPACGSCYDSTQERCDRDGAELQLTLPVERALDGKYRLERALGRGGFGAVYQASDLRLDRQVAAKIMIGSLFGDQTALRRFEREARASAKIDHPNITRVHDYGLLGTGGAYLIMELVAGRTWRAELKSGPIPTARAAEWFGQLLAGLQLAHSMGIVHRDLKPENVMIVEGSGEAPSDLVKIMDFGLAKSLDAGTGATEFVSAGTPIGTIGYMAPEMLMGGGVDERADLFAVGVMLIETLTGARPFQGGTVERVLALVLQGDYHLPGDSPDARAVDTIVQRCLAKDPRDRYGSAQELSRDLIPALTLCRARWQQPMPSPTTGTIITMSREQK
jgi:eukaryotic-like serine/threonine-protein kinase